MAAGTDHMKKGYKLDKEFWCKAMWEDGSVRKVAVEEKHLFLSCREGTWRWN